MRPGCTIRTATRTTHPKSDDLRQAVVVLAGVIWSGTDSDEELPRLPLPPPRLASATFRSDLPDCA